MYSEVGSFDAKAKLSELLREVQAGHRYTITLRGKPVADLVPSENLLRQDALAAVAAMQAMPKIAGVSSEDIASWIVEGRK